MSLWALRGLRDGVVTTKWPKRPDGYADGWRGPAVVRSQDVAEPGGLSELCPTGAISAGADASAPAVRLDQGRCILCGRCAEARPDVFAWSAGATGSGAAALTRDGLVLPHMPEDDEAIGAARARLRERTTALRRSVHVRHVDGGSDGSEEWEVLALLGPVYDIHRLGAFFTASPRHADILLVTGAGSAGMAEALRTTYEAMPDPRVVIAAGADAVSGGLLGAGLNSAGLNSAGLNSAGLNSAGLNSAGLNSGSATAMGGVSGIVPVDVWVPGSPPSPFGILNALLIAVGRLGDDGKGAR
jgi:Ni,Fe-hydrogenase III small subunit/ferredoxin